jgi:hypothetical protein
MEWDVSISAEALLRECAERGLIVKVETTQKKPPGRHWHLGYKGRRGVLELTDAGGAVTLKVAANRDGGWATELARELAKRRGRS